MRPKPTPTTSQNEGLGSKKNMRHPLPNPASPPSLATTGMQVATGANDQ